MSTNPLSIIELMEKEYDISKPEGDSTSGGERCFNDLFMIDQDNNVNIDKIKSMRYLYELGNSNNREELMYVELKIKKFILTDAHHISECFDLYNFTQEFCNSGLSYELLPLLGKIINLDPSIEGHDNFIEDMKVVENRLGKYVPEIVKKIIDISEKYELNNCNKISNNTLILKRLYPRIMKKNASHEEYEMPTIDFDLKGFIEGFQTNMITKTIFLIFLAFLIGKIISLFNVNYNVGK
tara:strand:- start:641 stop:1357 length:717 start_codon:yes stop_codon:yes gene_type:complete